jgi:hypothetical protein
MTNNYFISMQKGFLALMSAALLFSCSQIEPFEMEGNDKVLLSVGTPDYCVTSFPSPAVTVYTNTTFNVSVTAYNDAVNTYFTITRTGGNMTVRVAQPGLATTQTTGGTILEEGTTVTRTVPHTVGWKKGDAVTISYYLNGLGGGNTLQTGIITYNLRDICGCVNTMTADLTCGATNTVKYTFFAEVAGPIVIQGGLNANAVVTTKSSVGLTENTTANGVVNSNTSVTLWEGNVAACQEVTVSVSWTGPASVGDWTAKRNDVELAGVLGSSVVCPPPAE